MTKLWAVIPAGGAGLRYGSETPKQYITVAGLTVLEHVLKAFLVLNVFESIVVPVPSEDINFLGLTGASGLCDTGVKQIAGVVSVEVWPQFLGCAVHTRFGHDVPAIRAMLVSLMLGSRKWH